MGAHPAVWAVPGGQPFLGVLARWVRALPQPAESLLVFVPTSRAAAELNRQLAALGPGLLPMVLPLWGSPELAAFLGLTYPAVADPWPVRHALVRFLGAEAEATAQPRSPAALWRQAASLQRLLNRLEAYGISADAVELCVPKALALHWQAQAGLLTRARQYVQNFVAAQGTVLPGTAERLVLEAATAHIRTHNLTVVVAGVWEGSPAAVALAQTATHVVVAANDGNNGTLQKSWLKALKCEAEPTLLEAAQEATPPQVILARTAQAEATAVAAATCNALATGAKRVVLVCPQPAFAARLRVALGLRGVVPQQVPGLTLAQTAAGRAWQMERDALLAAQNGLGKARSLSFWKDFWARTCPATWAEGTPLATAFATLEALPGLWESADMLALIEQFLAETPASPEATTPGVLIVPPSEARLLAPDVLILCNANAGQWPAPVTDDWLNDAQLKALGLPENTLRTTLAAAEVAGFLHGGCPQIVLSRTVEENGQPLPPAPFVPQGVEQLPARQPAPQMPENLGVFTPHGNQFPRRWSASFVEGLMACPYKVYAERILKLQPLEALNPVPDARAGGLVAHAWLQAVAEVLPEVLTPADAPAAEATLRQLIPTVLEDEDILVRALWQPRLEKLAPALVALWVQHGRRRVGAELKLEAKREGGILTFTATLDRVEEGPEGTILLDYKTTTPPAFAAVAAGTKPQLAVESWLLEATGQGAPVAAEFWHLKGYGPAPVSFKTADSSEVTSWQEHTPQGLAALEAMFGAEGATFAALPDATGGGLLPSGVCQNCALAGVCRRHAVAESLAS